MKKFVSILIIQENNYILQHRDDKDTIANPNTYGAWGGLVEESDESITSAAQRELLEETGLVVEESELVPLGTQIRDSKAPRAEGQKIEFYFFALNLQHGTELHVHEGQGAIRLLVPYVKNDKVNNFAFSAIRLYENRFKQ